MFFSEATTFNNSLQIIAEAILLNFKLNFLENFGYLDPMLKQTIQFFSLQYLPISEY